MISSHVVHPLGASGNAEDFRRLFIVRVHELLWLGYARITPRDYANAEEEDITGDLTEAVDRVLDRPPPWAPWMTYYGVREEERVNEPARKGKRRRRVDIGIRSSETRPRTRFRSEAKRLRGPASLRAYLGAEGLGCFLDGRYAATDPDAGMLGYVQARAPGTWASGIGRELADHPESHAVRAEGAWHRLALVPALQWVFRSSHLRRTSGTPIDIYHTLLRLH